MAISILEVPHSGMVMSALWMPTSGVAMSLLWVPNSGTAMYFLRVPHSEMALSLFMEPHSEMAVSYLMVQNVMVCLILGQKGIEKIKDLSFYACTFKGVMVLHGTYNCVPDLRNTITSSHVDLSDLKINKESKKLLKERSRLKAINFVEKLMGRQLLEREKKYFRKIHR